MRYAIALIFVLISAVPITQTSATERYWVFFDDRGPEEVDEARLEEAVANLSGEAVERRLRNGYAVPFDPWDLPPLPEYISEVERSLGTEVTTVSSWLNAVSIECTAEDTEALKAMPFITAVRRVADFDSPEVTITENDGKSQHPYYGYGFDQINMSQLPALNDEGYTGTGVRIALLDTGFDTTFPDFERLKVVAGRDFTGQENYQDDQNGHGTAVLSIMAGYNPGTLVGPVVDAEFLFAKTEVTGSETEVEEHNWVAGMEWAEEMGADVLSTSLGYSDWYLPSDFDGNTAITTRAANIGVAKGMFICTSAGNGGPGPTTITAPSDGYRVIAVGAVDAGGDIAGFSSRGPSYDGRIKPEISARGVDCFIVDAGNPGNYRTGNGTSFACPITASAAALVLEKNPGFTVDDMRVAMLRTGTYADNPNNDIGYGIVQGYDMAYFDPDGVPDSNKPIVSIEHPDEVAFNADGRDNELVFTISARDTGFGSSLPGISYWQIAVTRHDKPYEPIWLRFGTGDYYGDVVWDGFDIGDSVVSPGLYNTYLTAWNRRGYINTVKGGQLLVTGIGARADDAIAYPNPYRPYEGDDTLVITNLPLNSNVSIYTIAGDLVYGPITVADGQTELDPEQLGWASGVYLFRVETASAGEYVGKIAIIR
ncbi:MAG: S8 family serine peptidase [bacterium]|nr:S8 family serine peptidase [bacterium]